MGVQIIVDGLAGFEPIETDVLRSVLLALAQAFRCGRQGHAIQDEIEVCNPPIGILVPVFLPELLPAFDLLVIQAGLLWHALPFVAEVVEAPDYRLARHVQLQLLLDVLARAKALAPPLQHEV